MNTKVSKPTSVRKVIMLLALTLTLALVPPLAPSGTRGVAFSASAHPVESQFQAAPSPPTQQTLAKVSDSANLGSPASPGSLDKPGTPLGEMLNSDGTLNLSTGFSGSLDPSGWAMVSGAGEPPRFAPAPEGRS